MEKRSPFYSNWKTRIPGLFTCERKISILKIAQLPFTQQQVRLPCRQVRVLPLKVILILRCLIELGSLLLTTCFKEIFIKEMNLSRLYLLGKLIGKHQKTFS